MGGNISTLPAKSIQTSLREAQRIAEISSHDELRRQLLLVSSDHQRSATLPSACYADPALFRYDVETLFRQSWVGVGRADRWKSSGDFGTRNIGGVPVLFVRDQGGELRAFANSCRHRGSLLLDGEGNCKKIRCPFHCWTYDLAGRLVFAPRMEKVPDFDPAAHGLTEFRIGLRDGFAFVNLGTAAGGLDSWLGDFSSLHAPWGLTQWATARTREFEVRCNWKSYLEVFNEYYHLPYVHPASINRRYMQPDDADDVCGNFTTQFGATDGNAALLADAQKQALPGAGTLTGRERNGVRYTWVYPNMTFAASPDSLWMYEAYPLAPDRCCIVQTVCFPAETFSLNDFEARTRHYYDRIDAAIAEDIPFLERQQAGLSAFTRQGRFSPLEPSVAKFAHWYAGHLRMHLG